MSKLIVSKAKEKFMRELYEFCLQHESCSRCPMQKTCLKSGLEQKYSIVYEEYLLNMEKLKNGK